MARRGMTGQLNMFDFFSSLDAGVPGEVEMVSLVPDFEDEPVSVAVEPPEVEENSEAEELPEIEEEPEITKEPVTEEKSVVKEEPEVVENPVAEEEPAVREKTTVAMSRSYVVDGVKMEIAYINYNKVRITKGDGAPTIKEFASTKEAVDYYVEKMQELEADE